MGQFLRAALVAVLVASIGLLPFPVAAATVGQLAGQLTDTKTHAPLGNVKVTAVSPSGRATATTDARGFYSLLGLVPDTYAISFERSGYQTGLLQGITVTADTTTTADQALAPSLQQIGHVATRSVSSAFQPDQPHDTYTVSSKDITEEQGTALNINATQLFSSLPSVTNAGQNMGVPVIRAGRANEIGVSVNGIPVTNAYSGTYGAAQLQDMSYSFDVLDSIPTLAIRDVQLTPGVADASYGATGTGNFNIVFKKGTYPSFSDAILGIGGGHYYHGFSFDHGWATPDGRWATYFMFHGDNTYPHWGPQNTAQEVGVQGYPGLTVSRQFVGNVNYNWGQDNKFGLEFQAYSDYGALAADYGLNNNTLCFSSCNQSVATGGGDCGVTGLDNTNLDPHNGPVATINPVNKNTILMPNCWALLPYYPGQTNHAQSLGSAGIPAYSEDFPHYNYSLAFHENLNPSTYFNARYFRAGGYETDDRANGGATAYIWQKGGTTTGLTMDLTSQLGSKNLLKVGGQFSYENPQVNQSLPGWGLEIVEYGALTELYDFTPQNYGFNGCAYTGALAAAMLPNNQNYCGYLENVTGAGLVQIPGKSLITNIHPHFWSGYITDQWKPNSHLIVNAGGRLDAARYDYPAVGLDPATCTSLYTPLTVTPPTDANGNYVSIVPGKTCPIETFPDISKATHPSVFQPRIGAAFEVDRNNAFRADYGRSISWVPESSINPQTVDARIFNGLVNVPSYFNPAEYCLGFTGVTPSNDPRCSAANFATAFSPGQSVGFYSSYNPFPCKTALVGGKCPSNPNYPLPPPGQPNPSGAPACGIPPALVPCLNYAQQLFWEYQNDFGGFGPYLNANSGILQPIPPAQFSNYSLGYTHNFANGIGRGVLQSLTQGVGLSITAWKRNGGNLQFQQNLPILNTAGGFQYGPNNQILAYPTSQTSDGIDLANGLETRITRSRPYGLSMQFSATYQHAVTNVFADPNNVYSGLYSGDAFGSSHTNGQGFVTLSGAASAGRLLNQLYKTAYISPLTTNTTFSFRTRSGWRLGVNVAWANGYPIGAGEFSPTFIGGNPYIVPNTNGINGNGATRYIDPMNPGTQQNPNIAANNGVGESRFAWGKMSPPQSITNLQLEKELNRHLTAGVSLANLFNQVDSGAQLNGNYQPVANGIAGPKSGMIPAATATGYTQQVGGIGPYMDVPRNEGRTYYLYLQFKGL